MKAVYQVLAFLTVTTVIYLLVKNSVGAARVTSAAATAISTVQKTAQGR